jgi:arylsulfatase A-like enzyme
MQLFYGGMTVSIANVSSFLLACAVLWSTALACTSGSEPKPVRDVLLITVDTLRADFLESYASHGVPTPGITALAERGARFEQAIAASSATAPSHASIMTSRFARHHSVGPFNGNTRLEGVPTLAESFHEAGFETGAFVSNAVLLRRLGLDRGFDHYDDEVDRVDPNRPTFFERRADTTAQRAIAWLRGRGDRPFFAWVHFQDPHGPYNPPPPFDTEESRFPLDSDPVLPMLRTNSGRGGIPFYQRQAGLTRPSEYLARYAGEIAYMDEWLSKVVAEAERASGDRGLVIAVTADHGEGVGENGWFFQHGYGTGPELVGVPLILAGPGIAIGVYEALAHHVDLAPTLLVLAGLAPFSGAQGRSFAAMLAGGSGPPAKTLFSDIPRGVSAYRDNTRVRVIGPLGPPNVELRGQRSAEFSDRTLLVFEAAVRGEDGVWRKIDVPTDRREELLEYVSSEAPPVPAGPVSEAQVERLRALGYLPPKPAPESPSTE